MTNIGNYDLNSIITGPLVQGFSGIHFNRYGTKLYLSNRTGSYGIHQFTLGTAWDVSSASYDGFVAAPPNCFTGRFYVSRDGTMVLITGLNQPNEQYSLSVNYDVLSTWTLMDSTSLPTVTQSLRIYEQSKKLYQFNSANPIDYIQEWELT
jgi:hypothetical protein